MILFVSKRNPVLENRLFSTFTNLYFHLKQRFEREFGEEGYNPNSRITFEKYCANLRNQKLILIFEIDLDSQEGMAEVKPGDFVIKMKEEEIVYRALVRNSN